MIFVTVGTHEQQFDRLVSKIDELVAKGLINEEVFIQTGYSNYQPRNCKWSKLISYKEMQEYISNARIVITHGGPASFIAPLQVGKIPIVVPRQFEFDEHVNNHQLDFALKVKERQNNIIVVQNIDELENMIINYDNIVSDMNCDSNRGNEKFIEGLRTVIDGLGLK